MASPAWTATLSIKGPEALPTAILRLHRCDGHAAAALGDAFGIEWPTRPNMVASRQALSVLWLAPTEWKPPPTPPRPSAKPCTTSLTSPTAGRSSTSMAPILAT